MWPHTAACVGLGCWLPGFSGWEARRSHLTFLSLLFAFLAWEEWWYLPHWPLLSTGELILEKVHNSLAHGRSFTPTPFPGSQKDVAPGTLGFSPKWPRKPDISVTSQVNFASGLKVDKFPNRPHLWAPKSW